MIAWWPVKNAVNAARNAGIFFRNCPLARSARTVGSVVPSTSASRIAGRTSPTGTTRPTTA
jgi:hypothetical protein